MLLSLFNHSDSYVPVLFDEAGMSLRLFLYSSHRSILKHVLVGHRVATQYLVSALEGHLPFEHLLHYRAANSKLPGHPELGLTPGVKFSSGRLGHVWPFVNGIALANKDKTVFMLGSDGSQQVRVPPSTPPLSLTARSHARAHVSHASMYRSYRDDRRATMQKLRA